MSHSIKLNEELGVIVLRYRGNVDVAEIRHAFDEMVRLPGFQEGISLVADFRDTMSPLTGEEVQDLAYYAKQNDADWGVTKWALLASRDLTFGLARMYSSLTADYKVTTSVFRDAKKADDWLGLGVEVTEILARTPE
jgi:hypothetical protein